MSNEASQRGSDGKKCHRRVPACLLHDASSVVIIGASAHSNNHRHPSINPVHVCAMPDAPLCPPPPPRIYVQSDMLMAALKSITRLCREFIWLLLKDLGAARTGRNSVALAAGGVTIWSCDWFIADQRDQAADLWVHLTCFVCARAFCAPCLHQQPICFMTCEIESDAKGQMDFLGKSSHRALKMSSHRLAPVHPSNWVCKKSGWNSGLKKSSSACIAYPSVKFLKLKARVYKS